MKTKLGELIKIIFFLLIEFLFLSIFIVRIVATLCEDFVVPVIEDRVLSIFNIIMNLDIFQSKIFIIY